MMSQSSGATSPIRRIQRELKEISESPSRHWTAAPVADDLFEWQFAVRGPPGTDFEGGIYTGRIALPVNYPLAPPSIMLLTPNGRFEVGKKICLSNTSYHPELWQPSWGIRTIMEALRSHFPMPGDGAIGAIEWPSDMRKRLAKESLDFVCQPGTKRNRELLPELSPDELREELPEVPLPPPTPAQPPHAGLAAAVAASEAAATEVTATEQVASGTAGAAGFTAAAAAVVAGDEEPQMSSPLPSEGLRQRHRHGGAEAGVAEVSHGAVAQVSHGASTVGSTGATVQGAVADSAPPRRRRDCARSQRRPQAPLLIQLLKPPTTGRGWVLLVINLLIVLLTASFMIVLSDIFKNPPKLLDPLPEPEERQG